MQTCYISSNVFLSILYISLRIYVFQAEGAGSRELNRLAWRSDSLQTLEKHKWSLWREPRARDRASRLLLLPLTEQNNARLKVAGFCSLRYWAFQLFLSRTQSVSHSPATTVRASTNIEIIFGNILLSLTKAPFFFLSIFLAFMPHKDFQMVKTRTFKNTSEFNLQNDTVFSCILFADITRHALRGFVYTPIAHIRMCL